MRKTKLIMLLFAVILALSFPVMADSFDTMADYVPRETKFTGYFKLSEMLNADWSAFLLDTAEEEKQVWADTEMFIFGSDALPGEWGGIVYAADIAALPEFVERANRNWEGGQFVLSDHSGTPVAISDDSIVWQLSDNLFALGQDESSITAYRALAPSELGLPSSLRNEFRSNAEDALVYVAGESDNSNFTLKCLMTPADALLFDLNVYPLVMKPEEQGQVVMTFSLLWNMVAMQLYPDNSALATQLGSALKCGFTDEETFNLTFEFPAELIKELTANPPDINQLLQDGSLGALTGSPAGADSMR